MSFVANLVKQKIKPETFLDNMLPEQVLYNDNFNLIKYAAFYFIENLDVDGAAEFARKLEKLLLGLSAQSDEERQMLKILRFWMLRLKVFSLGVLSPQEQTDVFKKYIVEALEDELDVRTAVFKYIDIFSTGQIIQDIVKGYSAALLNSNAILGKNQSQFSQNNFRPTVSNWLKQYQAIINRTGLNIKPEAFEVVNFINKEKNVGFLDKDEKETLKSLLELYNWLLSPIVYVDVSEQQRGTGTPYMNSQKLKLPQGLNVQAEADRANKPQTILQQPEVLLPKTANTPVVAPPKVPAPEGLVAPQKVQMKDILGDRGQAVGNQQIVDRSDRTSETNSDNKILAKPPTLSAVLPDYKKPLPPPILTADNLAQQMEKRKQEQIADSRKQIGNSSQQSVVSSQQNKPAPSKAESYLQKQIDKKLHDLEEKAKGKNN